jgi:hypothetical protein
MMELDCMDSNGKVGLEEFIFKLQQISPDPSRAWPPDEAAAAAAAAGGGGGGRQPGGSPFPEMRSASFETMFPANVAARTRAHTELSAEGGAGAAAAAAPPGCMAALAEVATMLTAAEDDSQSCASAEQQPGQQGRRQRAHAFLEVFVHNKVSAAIGAPCMARRYLPMRVELVSKLATLAAAAQSGARRRPLPPPPAAAACIVATPPPLNAILTVEG